MCVYGGISLQPKVKDAIAASFAELFIS